MKHLSSKFFGVIFFDMQKRLECEIFGRVQMVMFRDFAQRHGERFGLIGEVRNTENGTVIVVAEGEEEILRKYLEELKKGPLFAKVLRIDEKWQEPKGEYENFKITYKNIIDRI